MQLVFTLWWTVLAPYDLPHATQMGLYPDRAGADGHADFAKGPEGLYCPCPGIDKGDRLRHGITYQIDKKCPSAQKAGMIQGIERPAAKGNHNES